MADFMPILPMIRWSSDEIDNNLDIFIFFVTKKKFYSYFVHNTFLTSLVIPNNKNFSFYFTLIKFKPYVTFL